MSPDSSSSKVEHLFLIGTHVHVCTVHICICTCLVTQISTNRKHSTHTNTSCLILCPSLVDQGEIAFVENMRTINMHTILISPGPGLRHPDLSSIWPLDALSPQLLTTGHPQLPHAQTYTHVTGPMSVSRPIWLYARSHSPRALGVSSNQFTDLISSPDL